MWHGKGAWYLWWKHHLVLKALMWPSRREAAFLQHWLLIIRGITSPVNIPDLKLYQLDGTTGYDNKMTFSAPGNSVIDVQFRLDNNYVAFHVKEAQTDQTTYTIELLIEPTSKFALPKVKPISLLACNFKNYLSRVPSILLQVNSLL